MVSLKLQPHTWLPKSVIHRRLQRKYQVSLLHRYTGKTNTNSCLCQWLLWMLLMLRTTMINQRSSRKNIRVRLLLRALMLVFVLLVAIQSSGEEMFQERRTTSCSHRSGSKRWNTMLHSCSRQCEIAPEVSTRRQIWLLLIDYEVFVERDLWFKSLA